MKKLTAEKCCQLLDTLNSNCMSILEGYYAEALEIALPILEQQERGEASIAEESIGVWNPLTKEIAVDHNSGIKVVDVAHWHCHCTMEVIAREMPGHPMVKAKKERGEGGWVEWGGGLVAPVTVRVEYLTRLGNKHITHAGDLRWHHEGKGGDIIAYRIIPERAANQNGDDA